MIILDNTIMKIISDEALERPETILEELRPPELHQLKQYRINLKLKIMKNLIYVLFALSFIACDSQEKKKKETQEPVKKEQDTIKPKESWDVKKEYDEFGNLIKYDSIYSYSYSNIKGDSIKVNLDSIMNSFRGYFEEISPFRMKDRFSYFPQNDSLFMNDFFREDYFFSQWKQHPLDVEKMIRQMDSTRNLFLKRFHPGLLESKDKNKM